MPQELGLLIVSEPGSVNLPIGALASNRPEETQLKKNSPKYMFEKLLLPKKSARAEVNQERDTCYRRLKIPRPRETETIQ